ncbi:MAG: hypothetical protein ACXVB9_13605 [Bdellovibrionota bacterium]
MKTWILSALVLSLPTLAHAHVEAHPWQAELESYKASLPAKSNKQLILLHAGNSAMAIGSCSASAAITGASFVAESLPVVNGLSEILANEVDPDYKTVEYKSIFSWEALTELGRGTVGGGVIALKDALKFISLWLSGEQDLSFEAAKKIYASSFANAEALFANQGKCMMSISKIIILRTELEKRGVMAPVDPNEIVSPNP